MKRLSLTKGGMIAMKLTPNKEKGILFKDDVQLIPIPYSAAKGIKWCGQGMGKSLASAISLHQ